MSEYKVISRAEDVCRCDRETVFGQMEKKDPGSAKRMQVQFSRLDELCGKYRAEEASGRRNPETEAGLLSTMNKMGDMTADFVFEQKDSDTAEMAGLFARLGYADGNEELSGRQLKNLRDFGHDGNIEQMFTMAGEMSDDAIPVMEAFRDLQNAFRFRENGDMGEYSRTGLFDGNCLKKIKKCCSLYLDTPGTGNTMEQTAVRTALTFAEKAESLSAGAERGRQRMNFADILREEDLERGSRRNEPGRMRKRENEPRIQMQKEEPVRHMAEKSRGSRSL